MTTITTNIHQPPGLTPPPRWAASLCRRAQQSAWEPSGRFRNGSHRSRTVTVKQKKKKRQKGRSKEHAASTLGCGTKHFIWQQHTKKTTILKKKERNESRAAQLAQQISSLDLIKIKTHRQKKTILSEKKTRHQFRAEQQISSFHLTTTQHTQKQFYQRRIRGINVWAAQQSTSLDNNTTHAKTILPENNTRHQIWAVHNKEFHLTTTHGNFFIIRT